MDFSTKWVLLSGLGKDTELNRGEAAGAFPRSQNRNRSALGVVGFLRTGGRSMRGLHPCAGKNAQGWGKGGFQSSIR